MFFFVALRWAPQPFGGARAKKKHHPGCFFFCSGPGERQGKEKPPLGAGTGPEQNTQGVSCGPGERQGKEKPRSAGPEQKKNTLGGGFVFAAAPRGRSLTHCGPGCGGDASPSPGGVFFFCCGPARTGVVFFFSLRPRPDAHSLTVGWGDFGKARVVFFFLLRPRRVFLDNNKKCLGYYIGSKKTRRGHSNKKKHHFLTTP